MARLSLLTRKNLLIGQDYITSCGRPPWVTVRLNRQHNAPALAEADSPVERSLAPGAEDHFVAVFQKTARFTARQSNRIFAAPRQFEHAAAAVLAWTGYRTAADQVSGQDTAAVRRMVRDHLGDCPVHGVEPRGAELYRFVHAGGAQPDLEHNAEGPIVAAFEVWQRLRIGFGARVGRALEGIECFGCDDPWRDRRSETLGEER